MDMRNVCSLAIPGGDVTQITSGDTVLWKKPRLPPGYQEVEWVQMGGGGLHSNTIYLELDYMPTQNTRLHGAFCPIELSSTQATQGFYGARMDASGRFGYCNQSVNASGNTVIWWNQSLHKPASGADYTSTNKIFRIRHDKQYFSMWIDDTQVLDHYDCGAATFAINDNLRIGVAHSNSSLFAYQKLNVYEIKVFDDTSLVYHLVPCYRRSDGKIGMFDLVNSAFMQARNEDVPITVKGSDVYIWREID